MEVTQKLARRLRISALITLSLAAGWRPASASESWILPAAELPFKTVAEYPVTLTGETHFTFAVPDSFVQFQGAKIVLIAKKRVQFDYRVGIAVGQNLSPVPSVAGIPALNGTQLLQPDVVWEIGL